MFYRPPCENILDNLEEIKSDNPSRHYKILLGDFNFPDIDWSAAPKCIVKPCSKRYSFHKKAIDLIKCANLKQLVHEPTHNLGNTLDLVFVEKPLFDDLSFRYSVLQPISDYNPILLDMSTTTKQPKPKRNVPTCYIFNKADYAEINMLFDKLYDNIVPCTDVYSAWE